MYAIINRNSNTIWVSSESNRYHIYHSEQRAWKVLLSLDFSEEERAVSTVKRVVWSRA